MGNRKQIHVIKLSTDGMRWNRERGNVVIKGTRDADPGRSYHLVIDNVDDMQRLVTHLQNAIAGIEGGRPQADDVVEITDEPDSGRFRVVRVESEIARLWPLNDHRQQSMRWVRIDRIKVIIRAG